MLASISPSISPAWLWIAGRRGEPYGGGFSLTLWRWWDAGKKQWSESRFRSRLAIQHLDSKKSFIQFKNTEKVQPEDQHSVERTPSDSSYTFPGRFLDLRTFTHALTGESHTLESACKAFAVDHGKAKTDKHGVITPDYIAYNRRDVLASKELLEQLREEFDRHPIDLDPCKAYSPASIASAHRCYAGTNPQPFESECC